MQVKKFEARTMKEALEMVKTQLGPDAVILSARDNKKSFGLVGEGSVEITAAVSEETLRKKQFVESRLREQDKEHFLKSPARQQKQFMEKMISANTPKQQGPAKPITSRRYADIDDDFDGQDVAHATNRTSILESGVRSLVDRLEGSKQSFQSKQIATPAVQNVAPFVAKSSFAGVSSSARVNEGGLSPKDTTEVLALKSEIANLRQMVAQFQQNPGRSGFPGAEYGLTFDFSNVFEKLIHSGMAAEFAAEILDKAQKQIPQIRHKNRSIIDGWVAREILDRARIAKINEYEKVQVFVGPSGSGKTSSLIKMASHLVIAEKKKIALLSTDTKKVGAAEQMKIYAQILNVPFAIIRGPMDWQNVMRYMGKIDVALVDMPGLSLKSKDESDLLARLMPPSNVRSRTHLVLNCTSRDADINDAAKRYMQTQFADAIFTGLDEATSHGCIYNFMRRFNIPVHSFGIGPKVPEDFEFATAERVLDLIMRITNSQNQEAEAL